MNSVNGFKDCLAEVIKETTLNESNWRSENWKKPWDSVNQDVLTDAFEKHNLVRSIFVDFGEIIPRNCKSISRVEKKMTEQPTGRENYFKVVSDFVAGRVHCNVNEIQTKIDYIRKIVLENNGQMHVRGASNERPYGFFMNADKKFTDITQYVYVFIEKVGYPIEFQIGHEFASHTFTIDSALRDNRDCGKVDLWDKDFYGKVKSYILAKANNEVPGSKEEINSVCAEMHKNSVPAELQQILDKI
ncbi:MAG: hypothetical protein H0V82_01825 [Candidatus Protochlamydia sp.]|nr:hypothetical protein [Candidatus Protochlamydia sp.]